MKAYSDIFLEQIDLIKKAKSWHNQNYISKAQYDDAKKTFHLGRYHASIFVKIGLFIFTTFTILASVGLFALFFLTAGSIDGIISVTCLLFAGICIFILERNIASERWYNNGIDNALLYCSVIFIGGGIFAGLDNSPLNSLISVPKTFLLLVITTAAAIRYVDRFLALVSTYLTFQILTQFFVELKWQPFVYSFMLILLAGIIYFVFHKLAITKKTSVYHGIYETIKLFSALIFYVFGNYHFIRLSTNTWQSMHAENISAVPMAWFYYLFTAIVPIVFVYLSLKQKDKPLLWIALIIIAASALTFRTYFSLGHPEIALTLAGIILAMIAYLAIKYLNGIKHGLSADRETQNDNIIKSNIEAIILNESFNKSNVQIQNQTETGSGTFGGAGSGNNF